MNGELLNLFFLYLGGGGLLYFFPPARQVHPTRRRFPPGPKRLPKAPIMRENINEAVLESDSRVIIRATLPVAQSRSWTEAHSVAQSERKMLLCM